MLISAYPSDKKSAKNRPLNRVLAAKPRLATNRGATVMRLARRMERANIVAVLVW
jgi:hypothetical protein